MATRTMAPNGIRTKSLPLNLQPYNVLYMALLTTIVLTGTIYSLIHSTHVYNVMLSNSGSMAGTLAPKAASSSTLTSSTPRLDTMVDSARLPATIFADRRNLLNRVFIKFAWGWTTLAFLAQVLTLRATGAGVDTADDKGKRPQRRTPSEEIIDAHANSSSAAGMQKTKEATVYSAMSTSTLRYFIATFLWIIFASWFLGPPIMDRIRHYTGAECLPSTSSLGGITLPGSVDAQFCYAKRPLTPSSHPSLFKTGHHVVAAENGGSLKATWRGGHDISGHTYILILSSLYLLEELTPYLPYLLPSSLQVHIQHLIPRQFWAPVNPFKASSIQSQQKATINLAVTLSILALITAWCTSLFFTALYFHTPQEKISGLLVGLAASLLLPRKG